MSQISVNKSPNPRLYACRCVLIMLTLVAMQSCKKAVQMNEEGVISGFVVKIDTPAGDLLPGFDENDIPAFFNYGTMSLEGKQMEFLVMGSRASKSAKIAINHLGTLEFEKEAEIIQWHVAESIDETKENQEESVISEIKLMNYQSSIEAWIRMQCPSHKCRNYSWKLPMHMYKEIDG